MADLISGSSFDPYASGGLSSTADFGPTYMNGALQNISTPSNSGFTDVLGATTGGTVIVPNGSTSSASTSTNPTAQANYNRLVNSYTDAKDTLFGSANTAAQNAATSYKNSILDWAYGLNKAQQGIDASAINAEMAKAQGVNGVQNMVGQGIKSSGVLLANRNAGDSSAAQAFANAYGQLGRDQLSGVNNQYAQEQNQIGLSQQDLEAQRALGLGKFKDQTTQSVNSIVDDAAQKIAKLNADSQYASLPDRIAIDQAKEQIRQQAMQALQQYDSLLTEKNQSIAPQSQDAIRQKAASLLQAGTAPSTAFNYSTQAPVQFQNTGPYASSLPIFTFPQKSKQNG